MVINVQRQHGFATARALHFDGGEGEGQREEEGGGYGNGFYRLLHMQEVGAPKRHNQGEDNTDICKGIVGANGVLFIGEGGRR
jgi:hypothetical protein